MARRQNQTEYQRKLYMERHNELQRLRNCRPRMQTEEERAAAMAEDELDFYASMMQCLPNDTSLRPGVKKP